MKLVDLNQLRFDVIYAATANDNLPAADFCMGVLAAIMYIKSQGMQILEPEADQ